MYHPSRGGVRGGRDQFQWDDVKVDKHRENYIGHSIMAPVGRWQKGKDLHWYSRDKNAASMNSEAAKEEIRRIKEEEEQAMREALGLAPKRAPRPQGNRLDKHEYSELVKRSSTAEDLGAGHAEAAQVQGLGLYKGHQTLAESSSSMTLLPDDAPPGVEEKATTETPVPSLPVVVPDKEDHESRKRRHREEKRHEKEERRHEKEKRHEKREKKRSRDSDEKRSHRRDKERRRHDSDSD